MTLSDLQKRVLRHLKSELSLDDLAMTNQEYQVLPDILADFTYHGLITGTLDTEYTYGTCIKGSRFRTCLTAKGVELFESLDLGNLEDE